jgi:hypothetical protein
MKLRESPKTTILRDESTSPSPSPTKKRLSLQAASLHDDNVSPLKKPTPSTRSRRKTGNTKIAPTLPKDPPLSDSDEETYREAESPFLASNSAHSSLSPSPVLFGSGTASPYFTIVLLTNQDQWFPQAFEDHLTKYNDFNLTEASQMTYQACERDGVSFVHASGIPASKYDIISWLKMQIRKRRPKGQKGDRNREIDEEALALLPSDYQERVKGLVRCNNVESAVGHIVIPRFEDYLDEKIICKPKAKKTTNAHYPTMKS